MSMKICSKAGATGPGWDEARLPVQSHAVWPLLWQPLQPAEARMPVSR